MFVGFLSVINTVRFVGGSSFYVYRGYYIYVSVGFWRRGGRLLVLVLRFLCFLGVFLFVYYGGGFVGWEELGWYFFIRFCFFYVGRFGWLGFLGGAVFFVRIVYVTCI